MRLPRSLPAFGVLAVILGFVALVAFRMIQIRRTSAEAAVRFQEELLRSKPSLQTSCEPSLDAGLRRPVVSNRPGKGPQHCECDDRDCCRCY